ncbi:polysaccharide biosynthesis/export family protein [Pseudoblastomonas halimionae]|uniref:Polysaccharide biosynthesis protein n=1 Tax=Alteriqipengyuania halimionae TaxID=1926630 RepID=A0A6I4U6B1_9SPHN|nr:polysaccharide biosynthesis/export family protein [Alteriqipengyuania halimionae]MXP10403.1 polysaccharide biosynthesis protein [Alteriqipengyuania halimionae]
MSFNFDRRISVLAMAASLGACVSGPAPSNISGSAWLPGQDLATGSGHPEGDWVMATPAARGAPTCDWRAPRELSNLRRARPEEFLARTSPLSQGDRLSLRLLGDEDELGGTYVIESNGTIVVPGHQPLMLAGRSVSEAEQAIRAELVRSGVVRPLRNAVSLSLIEAAGVPVAVSGAVFMEGAVRAGERTPESRIGLKEGDVRGDDNVSRSVATAIRAAGGVRPDADVQRIYLIRGDAYVELDLSGLARGWTANDVSVAAGDRVIVPSRGCFDPSLARPTPLTPPGIKVFMSNLTKGANNNAGAAIGAETTSLPYGTRLLQALVAMNCVGGSYMQSDRRAVLISRNPLNGQSIVVERDIEKLVRGAGRDAANPLLMPNDAIACYDSRLSNLNEVIGSIGNVAGSVTPAILLSGAE